jgi:hypothetical protein
MTKATCFLCTFGVSGYVFGNDRQTAPHPNAEYKPNRSMSQLLGQAHAAIASAWRANHYHTFATCSAVRNASAIIVSTGLNPPLVTCTEPSATYRLS